MHANRTDTVFHFQFVLFPFFDGFDAFATGDTAGNFFNVPKKLPDCFHRPCDQDVALKLHLPSKPCDKCKNLHHEGHEVRNGISYFCTLRVFVVISRSLLISHFKSSSDTLSAPGTLTISGKRSPKGTVASIPRLDPTRSLRTDGSIAVATTRGKTITSSSACVLVAIAHHTFSMSVISTSSSTTTVILLRRVPIIAAIRLRASHSLACFMAMTHVIPTVPAAGKCTAVTPGNSFLSCQ